MKQNKDETPTEIVGKMGIFGENHATKHLKVNEEARELLRLAKQHGETYSQTIARITKQNEGLERGNSGLKKGNSVGSGGILNIVENQLPKMLNQYGITPTDAGKIVKNMFKEEKVPRTMPKFNGTKAFGYLCWVGGVAVALYFASLLIGGLV